MKEQSIANAIHSIANAITPEGVGPYVGRDGKFVCSLSEAVIMLAESHNRIADVLEAIATDGIKVRE